MGKALGKGIKALFVRERKTEIERACVWVCPFHNLSRLRKEVSEQRIKTYKTLLESRGLRN